MASITINNLNNVDSSFSKDNYLIVGQGQVGRKTTIQDLFDLTKDSSSKGAKIDYISYSIDQSSITREQRERARQNLGINEQGTVIESGVSSVNNLTGDVKLYLTDLTASTDNPSKSAQDYIDEEIYNAIYGNKNIPTYVHNVDPDAHANAISAAIDDAISKLDIATSIAKDIDTHNKDDKAHTAAFAKFTTDTLSSYATKNYLDDTLDNRLSAYTKTVDLRIPTKLSDLSDGSNTIYKIIGASGTTPLTPTSADRSVTITAAFIGAVPSSRTVNNKSLADNITITANDIGAVPTIRKVNGQSLANDVNITASSINALSLESTGSSTIKGSVTINKSLSVNDNLNLTSKMFINSSMYGAALPSSGSTGQLFFVLESS